MNYLSNPQEFIKLAEPCLGIPFVHCLIEAMSTGREINFYDRLPRCVLKDVTIDISTSTLTFTFAGNVLERIQYEDYIIDQSKSAPTEFYITKKETRDYNVIIC